MSRSMVRTWLQGIQRYKNIPYSQAIPGFSNAQAIRSIRMAHSMARVSSYRADEIHKIMALWPDIVRDVTEGLPYNDVPIATEWMAQILAALQMQDDIIDCSTTRRGYPCWYLCENVGVRAVNDTFLVEHAAYQLLKKYFRSHESYAVLLERLAEIILEAALGQVMDISSSKHGKADLTTYTRSRYDAVVQHRGSFFPFLGPVQIAMCFTGITDPEMYRQSEPILRDMGRLYTVQDDYLDCFGDANRTGNDIGGDIEQGKCSWCIVTALECATPAQRKILEDCYAVEDPEKVARVKQVYNELDLPTIYANYEEKAYNSMKTSINKITCDFPKDLFDQLLALFYHRRA